MTKGSVFIQNQISKDKELMNRLMEIPEVYEGHLLFGSADLLTELMVEKSLVNPPTQHIAGIVEKRIARFNAVHDTDSYVPLESIIK